MTWKTRSSWFEERGTVRVVNLSADDEAGVHESPPECDSSADPEERKNVVQGRKRWSLCWDWLENPSEQQRFMLSSCNKNMIITKRVLFILYSTWYRENYRKHICIPDFLRIFKSNICICLYFISMDYH